MYGRNVTCYICGVVFNAYKVFDYLLEIAVILSMEYPTEKDINRIYAGFNQAYISEPERFDYLTISQFCDTDEGLHLEINKEVARGYWELFRLNNKMLLCMAECVYYRKHHQKIIPTEDIITIRFVLSGNYTLNFDNGCNFKIPVLSASILYTKKDSVFDLSIEKGSHLSSVTLHLTPEFLKENFSVTQFQIPNQLRKILFDGDEQQHLYKIPLSSVIINTVLDLTRMRYTGARRRLFTESKSIELVCRLFQEIEDNFTLSQTVDKVNSSLRNKLSMARQILINNYQNPISINALARKVGINRSSLCSEFKAFFGMTIFEFYQDYRMNIARELLQDGNLNVSQIAESVGYNHATNFTSAFKRQFGYLPKDIRNK